MQTRLLAMGTVVVLSAALAACGGGGGGGGGGGPVPPPPPPPTATPTANPFGCVGQSPFAVSRRPMAVPHPVATGDTFSYSGSYSKTYTQSQPCPQPTSTSNAAVSSVVTNLATSGPGGATVDQQSVEKDAFPTRTTTTTTDNAVTVTATAYQLFQTKSTDSDGNVLVDTYANPQQLDSLQTPPQSWNNNPASTLNETLTDGTSISRAISSDGSYVDTEHFSDGSVAVITVKGQATGLGAPDGSGQYAIQGLSFAFSAPASGSITLTVTQGGSTNRTIPAWFTVPAAYITDAFQANGVQALDPKCSVNPAIATQGKQVVETYSDLDPVVGYNESRTVTTYNVDGYGAVCVLIDDTLNSFYDYALDYALNATPLLYYSRDATPNSVDHITEALSLTAPLTPYPQLRTASARRAGINGLVAAHIAAIQLRRESERAERVRAMAQSLRTFAGKADPQ